jgi:hypothetical protein
MGLGALGYVGYGVEVSEGTFVAPTNYLPVTSFSFEDSNDFIVPDQIRHSRDRYIAMAAPYAVSGSMEMELIPNDVASILRSAFAATVISSAYAGGGYQHVYTPGSEEPTFTFESSASDVLIMRYSGTRVNTIEIKAAFGEIVMASFGLEGVNRAKQGSASSPTYTDVVPFHFSGVDIKVNSGTLLTTVKDFTFGVNNNIERIGTLRKTRSWKRLELGMREVTLALTIDFTDTSEYDRFLAEDIFDVDLHMTGPTLAGMSEPSTLRLEIPNVRWNKVNVPLSAGDYLEQAVEALIVAPIGGDIFTATLVNDESSVA